MDFKEKANDLKKRVKRLNQILIVFPLWIVIGISGIFRSYENTGGWDKSNENKSYKKMF